MKGNELMCRLLEIKEQPSLIDELIADLKGCNTCRYVNNATTDRPCDDCDDLYSEYKPADS